MLPRDRFQDVQVTGVGQPNEDYPELEISASSAALRPYTDR